MPKVQVYKKKKHAKKDDVVYDFIHVVINLKTDYYIIENGSGDFWNSDTNTLKYESQTGTLTEYSNYSTNTRTGQYETVETLKVNSYDDSTGAINFTLGGYPQRMIDKEPNNSWETAQHMARQAFKIDNSNTDIGDTSLPWAAIVGRIDNTVGMAATDQDYDWFKFDLQAGEKLTFDVDYGSGMSDDFDSFLDFFDENGARADNNAAASGSTGSTHAYTADGTPGYNDDNGKNAVTGAGSRDNSLGGGGSTTLHSTRTGPARHSNAPNTECVTNTQFQSKHAAPLGRTDVTGGVYPLWARRDASCIIIMMMNGLLPPRRLSMGKPRRRYIVARRRCAFRPVEECA